MTDRPPSMIVMNAPGTSAGPIPRACDNCAGHFTINLSTAATIADLGRHAPPVFCYDCAFALLAATRSRMRVVGNADFRTAMHLD